MIHLMQRKVRGMFIHTQHNKCQQADLAKLSPFVQKDAQKPPSHPSRCGRRYERVMRTIRLISFTIFLSACASHPDEHVMDREFWTEFRSRSSVNGPLFKNIYGKEGGVISHDLRVFPNATERKIIQIEVIKPFDIFQGGLEQCRVQHGNGLEVEYEVKLHGNGSYWVKWKGGRNPEM